MDNNKHSRYIEELGNKYGRLTVIENKGKDVHRNTLWLCHCECGNDIVVRGSDLRSGKTKSCGCLQKEIACKTISNYNSSNNYIPPSVYNVKHNMSHERLYNIWIGIKTRCFNSNHDNYKYYGERGITMCDIWAHDFTAFMEWACANGYNDLLTIDRIDPDENYCPDNCRWVLPKNQLFNKRNTIYMQYNGEKKPLKILCVENNIPYKWAYSKYKLGYTFEQIVKERLSWEKLHD